MKGECIACRRGGASVTYSRDKTRMLRDGRAAGVRMISGTASLQYVLLYVDTKLQTFGVRKYCDSNLVPTILRKYVRLQSPSGCCKFHIYCRPAHRSSLLCLHVTCFAWVEKTPVTSYRTVRRTRSKPCHI